MIQPSISFLKHPTTVADLTNRLNTLQVEYGQKFASLNKTTQKLSEENKQLRDDIKKLNTENETLKEKQTWC